MYCLSLCILLLLVRSHYNLTQGLLSPDEIEIVVQGFSDSILNKIADERSLLSQYGPSLNELLSSRSGLAGDSEKKSGQQFIDEYLLSNPKAVRTESGLVVNELVAGIGKQVLFQQWKLYWPNPSLTIVLSVR